MNTFIITNIETQNFSKRIGSYFLHTKHDELLCKKNVAFSHSSSQGCLGTGYLISDSGFQDLEKVEDIYRFNTATTIEEYDGMFSFCFIHKNKLNFFTDMFGLEKLYIYQCNNEIAISNKLLFLSQYLNKLGKFNFDDSFLKEWFVFGCSQTTQTPVRSVRYAEPSTYYAYSEGKLNGEKKGSIREIFNNYRFAFSGQSLDSLFDQLESIFLRYFECFFKNNSQFKIGCYLSAGLDSRTNAWALDKLEIPFTGLTYDCGSVEDTLSSLQYGALTNRPVINGFVGSTDELIKYMDMAAECFDFTQPSINMQFFPNASLSSKLIDIMFDGTSGDIFFGGLFRNNDQKYVKKCFGPLNFLSQNSGTLNYEQALLHNLETRQRYWIIPGLQALYSFARPFSTIYNKSLVKFCFSLGEFHLKDRRFHREFLQRKAKCFARIISDNFGDELTYNLGTRLHNRIKRKINNMFDRKRFFRNQKFWGIDYLRSDLYAEKFELDNETYQHISDLSNVPKSRLLKIEYHQRSYFKNFENFKKNLSFFL